MFETKRSNNLNTRGWPNGLYQVEDMTIDLRSNISSRGYLNCVIECLLEIYFTSEGNRFAKRHRNHSVATRETSNPIAFK